MNLHNWRNAPMLYYLCLLNPENNSKIGSYSCMMGLLSHRTGKYASYESLWTLKAVSLATGQCATLKNLICWNLVAWVTMAAWNRILCRGGRCDFACMWDLTYKMHIEDQCPLSSSLSLKFSKLLITLWPTGALSTISFFQAVGHFMYLLCKITVEVALYATPPLCAEPFSAALLGWLQMYLSPCTAKGTP